MTDRRDERDVLRIVHQLCLRSLPTNRSSAVGYNHEPLHLARFRLRRPSESPRRTRPAEQGDQTRKRVTEHFEIVDDGHFGLQLRTLRDWPTGHVRDDTRTVKRRAPSDTDRKDSARSWIVRPTQHRPHDRDDARLHVVRRHVEQHAPLLPEHHRFEVLRRSDRYASCGDSASAARRRTTPAE